MPDPVVRCPGRHIADSWPGFQSGTEFRVSTQNGALRLRLTHPTESALRALHGDAQAQDGHDRVRNAWTPAGETSGSGPYLVRALIDRLGTQLLGQAGEVLRGMLEALKRFDCRVLVGRQPQRVDRDVMSCAAPGDAQRSRRGICDTCPARCVSNGGANRLGVYGQYVEVIQEHADMGAMRLRTQLHAMRAFADARGTDGGDPLGAHGQQRTFCAARHLATIKVKCKCDGAWVDPAHRRTRGCLVCDRFTSVYAEQ